MPDLQDGQTFNVPSTRSSSVYKIKNVGGTYSCSCPAWRNQGRPIQYRTCNHLIDFRGPVVEAERVSPAGTDGMPSTVLRRVQTYLRDIATERANVPTPWSPNTVQTAASFLTKTVTHHAPPQPKDTPTGTSWARLVGADPFDDATPETPAVEVQPASEKEGIALLLAQSWDGVMNPSGWLMSEKLDGVRAYWDGKRFISRLGNVFKVPSWYTEGIPNMHLDGEFWMGRGRFQETVGYVRRKDAGNHWRQIKFMVFDAPELPGGFEERIRQLRRSVLLPDHVGRVCHWPCIDTKDLKSYLSEIEAIGGEGVMLRRDDSFYERTRSSSLLKVKNFFDGEATVTGYTQGKGRHTGRVGALTCKAKALSNSRVNLQEGMEFSVGTGLSDADRMNPPKIGATITFRFQELTLDGVPRFPSYLGQRNYE